MAAGGLKQAEAEGLGAFRGDICHRDRDSAAACGSDPAHTGTPRSAGVGLADGPRLQRRVTAVPGQPASSLRAELQAALEFASIGTRVSLCGVSLTLSEVTLEKQRHPLLPCSHGRSRAETHAVCDGASQTQASEEAMKKLLVLGQRRRKRERTLPLPDGEAGQTQGDLH